MDAAERILRQKLLASIEHGKASGVSNTDAVAAYVREAAFTTLNRFVALKMLEARGLVQECISRGDQSSGFKEFIGLAPGLMQLSDHGYRLYIESLSDEIGREVRVLFDRRDPASLLWPRRQALLDLLAILNDAGLAEVWKEDETISWVYQYFNSDKDREQARYDEKGKPKAPQNSYELAVRNQFFTPRYVVEFLTDNTLGRIWYEMRQGQTRLVEKCQYLVRRPSEVFLLEGEDPSSEDRSGDESASQEELLKKTVYIPFRPKKDPRDLKILDPACGSGHFLIYAFDLFVIIYEEAWLDPDLGRALWTAAGIAAEISGEISGHGEAPPVDPASCVIRPGARAHCFSCESTGPVADARFILADIYGTPWVAGRPMIYCATCTEQKQAGITVDIPLTQFNLQEALHRGWFAHSTAGHFVEMARLFDYRPGGEWVTTFEDLERASAPEFLTRLRALIPGWILRYNLHGIDIDPRCAQIAALALWMRAQRAYSDSSIARGERPSITKTNLVVAEPMPGEPKMRTEFIASLGVELRQLIERMFEIMALAGEAGSLWRVEDEIQEAIRDIYREHGLLFQKTDEERWRTAETELLTALRIYAHHTEDGALYQRRLFAEDAERGFTFIDLCRQQYDVVVTNPPFGEASLPSKSYIEEVYGDTKGDVYKAFVECFQDRLVPAGMLGIISSRTGFFLGQSVDWRERIVLRLFRPLLLADLGHGVLDAMVETAAYVLRTINREERRALLLELVDSLQRVPDKLQGKLSIATWQRHRGLKRHQAIHELAWLEEGGYLKRLGGKTVRYGVSLDALQITPAVPTLPRTALSCFRLTGTEDKETVLKSIVLSQDAKNTFIVAPESFRLVPGTPFAYWVSESVRRLFCEAPLVKERYLVASGTGTLDDFRFLRLWYEISTYGVPTNAWFSFAKGGTYSPYYSDHHLVVNWKHNGAEMKAWIVFRYGGGHWARNIRSTEHYFRPGLTWPRRTTSGLSATVSVGWLSMLVGGSH